VSVADVLSATLRAFEIISTGRIIRSGQTGEPDGVEWSSYMSISLVVWNRKNHTMGGFIHTLPVIAVAAMLVNILKRRIIAPPAEDKKRNEHLNNV